MFIAIDDTYGPIGNTGSKYVTDERRTHVAVIFKDHDVHDIRHQMKSCLSEIAKMLPSAPSEFHFFDIYNRKDPWDKLSEGINLVIFEFFCEIYSKYRWQVILQTIDDVTLIDHPALHKLPRVDGLNPSLRSDLALLWLCIKIRIAFKDHRPPIRLLVDQAGKKGRGSPGTNFGGQIFADWDDKFSGQYSASSDEPLIQIADFLAFIINRSTHLAMKASRSETDNWFLNLVGKMNINCDDLKSHRLPVNFSISDFDELHIIYRRQNNLV